MSLVPGWLFGLLLLHSLYIIVIAFVFVGLKRLKKIECGEKPFISVIVCGRNEESRIKPTLQSLENVDYPGDRFEIILVDDASTDSTLALMNRFAAKYDNRKVISISAKSNQLRGKKKAMKMGIDEAKGDIIFTTDADCRIPENWLKYMVCYFRDNVSMVLGHSPLEEGRGKIKTLLAFDNLFSAIVGAAPAKLGYPMTSVGRNLAYRKETYYEVGGFDALQKFKSGDDVHLTERFRKHHSGRVEYCAHPETFVLTTAPDTGKQLLHQQIRKNSKILNKSFSSILFSLFIFSYHILLVLFPFFAPALFKIWILIIGTKLLSEFSTLLLACRIFNKKSLIKYILFMQFFYPAYVVFFSILGTLQIYEWKK